jgi:7,8-dihydroneopterin aldolase/epimerase/oxygenase
MATKPLSLVPESSVVPEILCTVRVRDLKVDADIGVYAHEIGAPQRLMLAVTLSVRTRISDRLADTVDYAAIQTAAEALGRCRINLIETFAYRLARACLDLPGVEHAVVQVDKPGALTGALAGAEVSLSLDDLTH